MGEEIIGGNDPDQPKAKDFPINYRLRHYFGLNKMEAKLRCLLKDFEFTPIKSVLEFTNNLITMEHPLIDRCFEKG